MNHLSEPYYKIGIELHVLSSYRVTLCVLEHVVVFDRLGVFDAYLAIVFSADTGILESEPFRG